MGNLQAFAVYICIYIHISQPEHTTKRSLPHHGYPNVSHYFRGLQASGRAELVISGIIKTFQQCISPSNMVSHGFPVQQSSPFTQIWFWLPKRSLVKRTGGFHPLGTDRCFTSYEGGCTKPLSESPAFNEKRLWLVPWRISSKQASPVDNWRTRKPAVYKYIYIYMYIYIYTL